MRKVYHPGIMQSFIINVKTSCFDIAVLQAKSKYTCYILYIIYIYSIYIIYKYIIYIFLGHISFNSTNEVILTTTGRLFKMAT